MDAVMRFSEVDARAAGLGGESGEAMVQRCKTTVSRREDRVVAMMSMLSRIVLVSPERISRSEAEGIWPDSRDDTRSMQEWSSSGRVGARGGSVVSVSMRIWVDKKVERAVVRL